MSLDKRSRPAAELLFWSIDAALLPAATIRQHAEATISRLQASSSVLGGRGHFTAIHLRVEDDWVEHCNRWESAVSDPPRDNCMSNTDNLFRVFTIEGVDRRHPLYTATEQTGELSKMRGLLDLPHYDKSSRRTIWGHSLDLPRELGAFHDLIVCMAAHRFVGNSVSTCALRSGHCYSMCYRRIAHIECRCVRSFGVRGDAAQVRAYSDGRRFPLQRRQHPTARGTFW